MIKLTVPLDSNEESIINQLITYFPSRRRGKRGPKPISKDLLLIEIFKLLKYGIPWRNIKHPTVCRNYLKECQRRGLIKKMFHKLTFAVNKNRVKRSIVDTTLIESRNHLREVSYSGKSRKYGTRLTVEITPEYIPRHFVFLKGSRNDKVGIDKLFKEQVKLPYEVLLDNGYEGYKRRRELKCRGCQVRMDWRHKGNNRKRGSHFTFTSEHRRERYKVERYFSWLKSFARIKFRKEKLVSIFHAFVTITMCYYIIKRKL
jgi:hypothetical protein